MSLVRGEFSSRFGFLMAASGSAVGLGNIWGFPTNAASNGGAAFLCAYLLENRADYQGSQFRQHAGSNEHYP